MTAARGMDSAGTAAASREALHTLVADREQQPGQTSGRAQLCVGIVSNFAGAAACWCCRALPQLLFLLPLKQYTHAAAPAMIDPGR